MSPRLILADWLQDQGAPRGELVHLQVRRSRPPAGAPAGERFRHSEMRLLGQYCLGWLAPARV